MFTDKSVLIIESDETKSKHLEIWLERTPFKVNYILKDYAKLNETLKNNHFDIIITQSNITEKDISKFLLAQINYNVSNVFITEKQNKELERISKTNKNIICLKYPFERKILIRELLELYI